MNTMVAHARSFVIGIDTHAGRARAINWAGRRTRGDLGALWVIEGAGSYGAQIARQTARAGYQVAEASRMGRASRRGIGKSDPIDARPIAVAVLPLPEEQLRTPRMDEGVRAAAQILLASRDELTSERTRAVNALTPLVRIADLGIDARRPLGARQIGEIARWRPREEDLAATTTRTKAVRLAKRILTLDTEIADNMNRIGELVDASPAAGLPEETGIGPVTTATVMVAWPHRDGSMTRPHSPPSPV